MNSSFSFLDNLHQEFQKGLKEHLYINILHKAEETSSIKLKDVFKNAQRAIKAELSEKKLEKIKIKIALENLREDGKLYRKRYVESTNTWSRSFFKGLARYTPTYLKRFLPSCFSNRMEENEEKTKEQYKLYKQFLTEEIDSLQNDITKSTLGGKDSKPKSKDGKEDITNENEDEEIDVSDEEVDVSDEEVDLSDEDEKELETQRQLSITKTLEFITAKIQTIENFKEIPFSLNKFKIILIEIGKTIKDLENTLHAKESLKTLKLNGTPLSDTLLNVLSNDQFFDALTNNNDQKLSELLKPTDWSSSFEEALAQKDDIKCFMRKGLVSGLVFFKEEPSHPIRDENFLQNFRGKIELSLDENSSTLKKLEEFLRDKKNNKCRPYQIKIHLSNNFVLNAEHINLLMALSEKVSEIQIDGLKVINFKQLNMTADKEYSFVQRLDYFSFTNVEDMILSDHPKANWSSLDFSHLLSICPKMKFLEEFYRICPSPQDLIIPPQLLDSTSLNLTSYNSELDRIPHLLKKFTKLTSINLSGLSMTDPQLIQWINDNKKNLINLQNIHLENCPLLTEDISPLFDRFPNLTKKIIIPSAKEKRELETQRKLLINNTCDFIINQIENIKNFTEHPCSLEKYKMTLGKLCYTIQYLENSLNSKESLKNLGLSETLMTTLSSDQFFIALRDNNNQALKEFLSGTDWALSFEEALAHKGHIRFGMSTVTGLQLVNDQSKVIQKDALKNYRGCLALSLEAKESVKVLEELQKILNQYSDCRPYIKIQLLNNFDLTSEQLDLLITLSQSVSEIQIHGHGSNAVTINLTQLTPNQENLFVKCLDRFSFPHLLGDIILSNHTKQNWLHSDFYRLLLSCCKMEFLEEFYRICPYPLFIEIPPQLINSTTLNLSNYRSPSELEKIPHFLTKLKRLTSINLNGLPITDAQLTKWINKGYLDNIQSLHLENCRSLTTDILPVLAKLPKLAKLSLPDLPRGKLELNKLPKFDDPLKIALFYTASTVTQNIALSLYTGLSIWAAAFQIPLVRKGVDQIFGPNMTILDPKSVAYWLHANDYKKLKSQKSITTIQGDSNGALNDGNLVEFVKKFPETTTISLYNCPNITNAGIITLLKTCPKIQVVDLTDCRQITDDLLTDKNFGTLNNLEKLTLSDKKIPNNIPKKLSKKLVINETILKITNDQITDEDTFEKLLGSKVLNRLSCLDLTDCKNLTDAMLSKILKRLNTDREITTKDGTMKDNPQRLDLAVLNLSGCTQLSSLAFYETSDTGKQTLKLLENLDRIVIDSNISKFLTDRYPNIIFQEAEEPVTIQINPEVQLQACQSYIQMKMIDMTKANFKIQNEFKKLTRNFIHNCLVANLFSDECKDVVKINEVLSEPVKINSQEFCDFTLSFQLYLSDNDPEEFKTYRDVLSRMSPDFSVKLRPGGILSKQEGFIPTSIHATKEAAKAIMDLFYEKNTINNLDYETAGHVAELVGPNNFNFPISLYNAIGDCIIKQLTLENAEKIFIIIQSLKDENFKNKYEDKLIKMASDITRFDDDRIPKFFEMQNKFKLKNLEDALKTKGLI